MASGPYWDFSRNASVKLMDGVAGGWVPVGGGWSGRRAPLP